MIRRSPSKVAVFAIAVWWALIAFDKGSAFDSPFWATLMGICRSEWTVAFIAGTLAVLQGFDLAGRLHRRLAIFTWAASMVWWMFVAFCLLSERFSGTGVGAYFTFAGLAAAAWWQRKDEVARA